MGGGGGSSWRKKEEGRRLSVSVYVCVCVLYLAPSLIAVLKQCRVRVMDLKKLDGGNVSDSKR